MFKKVKIMLGSFIGSCNLKNKEILIASLILALGLSLCGYFISQTTYNSAVAANTAEAKGLAERRMTSDVVMLNIKYAVEGKNENELASLYEKAEKNKNEIISLLKENEISDVNIDASVLEYSHNENRDEKNILLDETYKLSGSISFKTAKVDKADDIREKLNKLILKGIDIKTDKPYYYFTRLNDIKPSMLKEATENARIAASEFAEDAGVEVGGIQSALQGGFSIDDVGDGMEKDVRVVTTIRFYLTK